MTAPDYRSPAELIDLAHRSRRERRRAARAFGGAWSNLALPRPPKSGPNRTQRRAAMQAQGPFLSQFGLRNDAIRREAQKRAAEAIRARAHLAALTLPE